MLEPNKYTNQSIHVANWLLGNGEAIEMVERARQAVAAKVAACPDDPGHYIIDELTREELADYIEERIVEVLGECFRDHSFYSLEEIPGVAISPENPWKGPGYYDNASPEDLIVPFVGQALDRLILDGVAEIIMEQVPAPLA